MRSVIVRRFPGPRWAPALLLLLAGTLPSRTPAPLTGRLEGTVRDAAGAPVVSAQVRLRGTSFFAEADSVGHYFINNVPAGTYVAESRYVGYHTTVVPALAIREGETSWQHFTLTTSGIEVAELLVTAEVPLVPRDEVSSKQRLDGQATGNLPVDRIADVLALQPGAVASTEGGSIAIRGGRPGEATAYIDGVPVSPGTPAAAPASRTGGTVSTLGPGQAGTNAFEDASVAGGALGTEFGNAQSGQITLQTPAPGTEGYRPITENRFLDPLVSPVSTFSIDVDAASYANVRRFLSGGMLPPPDAVRIEEMINYFDYSYPEPTGEHPFAVSMEAAPAPWNPEHQLLLIGLQGKHLDRRAMPPSNLVFLIDVSGSMNDPAKLPLVQQAFRMLVQQLRPEDRVAIVVYAGAAGCVLPSTSGADKATILAAIDRLQAGGSTAGGAGIALAYRIARENYSPRGNNRVILATDGDFNVGATSEADLLHMIEEYRTQGTFLTVLGFGTGNLKDDRMEMLADKGNGQYAYIDTFQEARRVFIQQFGGTLHAIAKDVKLQLEFNPATVAGYRLVGYENRLLAREDFDDDTKDAGELGAGHTVTALYEVIPAGTRELGNTGTLRYQNAGLTARARTGSEWLTLDLRYKRPRGERSILLSHIFRAPAPGTRPSPNFTWASAVAEFGLLLRQSQFRGQASPEAILERAQAALGDDGQGYRTEFLGLVRRYQELQYRSAR